MEEQKTVTDVIEEVAASIEGLSKEQAIGMVPSLLDSADFTNFKLGGVLGSILGHQWWKEEGFVSFKEFLSTKFPMVKYRKAMYLIDIYVALVESGVTWTKVGHLGWTKLKELATVINKDNVDDWVAKAENLTVLQLIEEIRKAKTKLQNPGEPDADAAPSSVTTITFKVHADQKETIRDAVEKAKEEAETAYDAVALEAICLNYLSGGGIPHTVTAPSLMDKMQKVGYEEVLKNFEVLWPEINLKVVI